MYEATIPVGDPEHLVSGSVLDIVFVMVAAIIAVVAFLAVMKFWSGARWFRTKFVVASILSLAGTAATTSVASQADRIVKGETW